MTTAEHIKQIEGLIAQRMDALAAQDPQCNRLMGRLDVLREIHREEPKEEAKSTEEPTP